MIAAASAWIGQIDALVAACIVPIAVTVLLGGLDDLTLVVVCGWNWLNRRTRALPPNLDKPAQIIKCIAIFVPCWREAAVIGKMIEHNISAINYHPYHFFIGVYPNDEPTLAAGRMLEGRFDHVHLAICPHDGPTSKADCLNWIYQRMLLFEEDRGTHFDLVVTHDAEDLIHPDSLSTINHYSLTHDMVQIPVLPLPTPLSHFTHGVYCDEFAEFQFKDMRAREIMGSFVPSSGVGTGYSRAALNRLAESESNRIFEPACLTEDYENGMRLHRQGCRQTFVPLVRGPNGFVATREFFPSDRKAAIRQRTRWIMGITLQTWERHGWRGRPGHLYWFWRDRKGLIGNPLSFATNLMFGWGALTWIGAQLTHRPWGLGHLPLHPGLLATTLALQLVFMSIRMGAVARVYGWPFATAVPLRRVWANYLNCWSTLRAISVYLRARLRHEPLVWVKTEHAYPSRTALLAHKRRLGEILVGSGNIDRRQLEAALASRPVGVRLGEYLVQLGSITEEELYEALSLQQSVPSGRLEPFVVPSKVARALPRKVIQRWKVLPYRIEEGSLFLASPEIPTDELNLELQGFTRMSLRFQLVTPANFEELTQALL